MAWLVANMWFSLCLAALLGVGIGWFLRDLTIRGHCDEQDMQISSLRNSVEKERNRRRRLEEELGKHETGRANRKLSASSAKSNDVFATRSPSSNASLTVEDIEKD